MPSLDLLVVDDEPNLRRTLALHFESRGHRVETAANLAAARRAVELRGFDVVFVDLRLGTDSGLELIPELVARRPAPAVVVITAHASLATAIEAMQRGAADYLPKPFKPAELDLVLERLRKRDRLERRAVALDDEVSQHGPALDLASESPAMQHVLDLARRVAASDTPLLLLGASGTGKSALARQVHRWSRRADGPFVVVPCPALPGELLESELFGHVKGAFTGASRDNPGRVALAEGGTLLLDEIGELPLRLQPKLLRFIQDREFERVGDPRTRTADVRILAATHRDLATAVAEGTFREDLFYRLNVIQLELPPLAARRADIPRLASSFLAFFARRHGRGELAFSPASLAALTAHPWPGNVRQLQNAVERAVLLGEGGQIETEHLGLSAPRSNGVIEIGAPMTLAAIEEAHIQRVLATTHSYREAAAILGIDETTLWRRRKRQENEPA